MVEDGDERYAFTWPGKKDAIRQSQTVSTATLRPCVEKSRSRDGEDGSFDSDNVYIEGDNLEVLKLLQRAYHGKVKMIYIDPPYNTGSDFIYQDSFLEPIENYKAITSSTQQANPESDGRYHSKWLTMMYPRLKIARGLLRREGILMASIGNHELSNLMNLCDEIFGYQCRLGIIAWESKTKCQNTSTAKRQLQPKQEYILVYAVTPGRHEFTLEKTAAHEYPETDENGNAFRYKKIEEMASSGVRGRSTMVYPILGVMPGTGKQWKLGKETVEEYNQRGDLLLIDGVPYFRCRQEDEEDSMAPFWSLIDKEIGTAESAKRELNSLMGETGFETVKPVDLIMKLIGHVCDGENDVVLDFFSGSATTAHAVMLYNIRNSVHLKSISIQLNEACAEGSISFAAGYKTISDIGEERIRRAGDKIKAELEESNRQLKLGKEPKRLPDIGFRVFKLDESGIRKPEEGQLLVDRVKPGRTDLDIIFEMMLKWGLELTYPVEREEINGYPVYSVACDELICCMKPGLTVETLEAIAEREPRRVFLLDSVIDDSIKLNALQIFKRVEERTQQKIDLRTV